MYAYTDDGNYFIYAHRETVSVFAMNDLKGASEFQDTVNKLNCIKYFNEKSENCIANLSEVEFDKKIQNTIKVGTCLLSKNLQINYKADVYIDNFNHVVALKIYDADEFSNNLNSDIELPDKT
jgi:hypothetical protein